jgi:GAF domain-containing protein
MRPDADPDAILAEIAAALDMADDPVQAAAVAMPLIQKHLPYYKWVGVYWLQGDTLFLGPYVGASTDHTRIPVGRGVCGTAVAENRNQLVDDVRKLGNYLACSLETRSEIVVLIRDMNGLVIGQIDADGHGVADFDARDEWLLSAIAEKIARKISVL